MHLRVFLMVWASAFTSMDVMFPSPCVHHLLSEYQRNVIIALLLLLTWQSLLERLDSKEWLVVLEAVNQVRQFSIFHTDLLQPIL